MLVQSIRVVLSVAVVAVSFAASASANECKTVVVKYNHFRPDATVVQHPATGASTDTTPLPATAPGHNRPPSALVTQPPRIVDVPCVEAGEELDVDVNFALQDTGTVIMRTGKFEMELPVTSWSARCVTFQLPTVGMLDCMPVSIHIYRPDGYLVRQFSANLVRSKSIRRVVRVVRYESSSVAPAVETIIEQPMIMQSAS
ncbi:MAG: hypothetical protein WBD20_10555 [Pirellulaceae bacterium]